MVVDGGQLLPSPLGWQLIEELKMSSVESFTPAAVDPTEMLCDPEFSDDVDVLIGTQVQTSFVDGMF